MAWANSTKPSVIKTPLWDATIYPWDITQPPLIEFPWQYEIENIWTNIIKP
jgi:hypothetical protein